MRRGSGVLPFSLLLILAGPPVLPAAAQTGTVLQVQRENRGRIAWDSDGRGARGKMGFVLDDGRVAGLVRVTKSKRAWGEVETVAFPWWRTLRRSQLVSLLEDPSADRIAGRGCFLVWSDRDGAPLRVDGKEAGEAPAFVILEPGSHQILVELPDGIRAGARLEVKAGQRDTLLLRGRLGFAPGEKELFLSRQPALLDREERTPYLRWIEEGDGTRIYLPGGPIQLPRPVKKESPRYPETARQSGLEGRVVLEGVVRMDGRFSEIRVLAGRHPNLAEAAVGAASRWSYEPARLEGVPVPLLVMTVLDFKIPAKPSTHPPAGPDDSGVYHPLRKGQTLFALHRAYRIPVATLMRVNRIANPSRIPAGTPIFIPGAARVLPIPVPGAPLLLWPLEGRITSGFGTRGESGNHEGLDIDGELGQEIRAAAGGAVVQAGTDGRYGKMILIDHGGGLTTFYAHASRLLVDEGDSVQAGDPIAEVGRSGNARGTHLHFEARRDGHPIDPLPLLGRPDPGATASR